MNRKKILSVLLALAMTTGMAAAASGCGSTIRYADDGSAEEQSQTSGTAQNSGSSESVDISNISFGLTDNIVDGVILHAWSWSFNTIKESMADIAVAGYSTIQTSPANACVEGGNGGMQLMGQGKWYYHYQPTDWTIGNYQLGTEDEFKAMCSEAEKYGIKIIVDVVPNHTTSSIEDVSQNLIDAVGGKDKLYHKSGTTDISNYGDRSQCTTGALSGLPDVNTENPDFQNYFISYLNQCIADGADGFRYDTAKHIALSDDPQEDSSLPNNFWERVTTEITNADTIFNYGEVLQGDNERIADYIDAIGCTTASSYGAMLRSQLSSGKFDADKLSDFQVGGSTSVVTWVESHDNYTDGTSLSLTDEQIIQGWAIIGASGNGTPLFFDRPFEANSDSQWGSMNRIGTAGSTLYKDSNVTAVNHFRNAMVGEDTKMSNPDTNVLMIERGAKGVVFVNGNSSDTSIDAATSLADGTYTDRASGTVQFTVSGGKITGTLPAKGIAVLYNEGYTEPVSIPSVSVETDSFTVTADSTEVTLHAQNSSKNTYTIDGTETEFSDGDKVSINVSGTTTLKVSATNTSGLTSTMTYYFTKLQTVASGSEFTFEKPASWGDTVYVYVYDETVDPIQTNAEWPGEEMTKSDGNTYSYTLKQDWSSGLVIFSDDNGNQYPAAMEPGQSLEAGKTYKSDSSASSSEESQEESSAPSSSETTINFKKPSGWGDVYAYVYENGGGGKNAEWPGEKMTDNGNGTYSYTVPSSVSNPVVIFTDGSNQYPVANEPGLEVENGKTYEAPASTAASSDGATVTFTKPDSWGSSINAYVYENGGAGSNAQWPGQAMTDNGDGTYSYTVPSNINNPLIIFNDGKNQYPNSTGLEVEDGKSYDINS